MAEKATTDPTLTVENVTEVMGEVRDWESVGTWLGVTQYKLQEIKQQALSERDKSHSLGRYWVNTDPNASWMKLGRVLYEEEEETASRMVKQYLPTAASLQREVFSSPLASSTLPTYYSPRRGTAASEVEMKDQQIQTETSETEHKDLQVQNITSPPEMHTHGAEVIALTKFTLTQNPQNLQFEGYGFKLHVPVGSLPAGVSETQLNVQVSLSGQFQMPPDCELLSAVYRVYSSHKFTKPLTVEIQHCGVLSSDQQCAQLTFVSAKCTQKELPYMFKARDGGVFGHHSTYGSLSLSQFSWLGVAKRKVSRWFRRVQPHPSTSVQTIHDQPNELATTQITETELSYPSVEAVESLEIAGHDEIFDQYCGQFYTRKGLNDCRLHFVITKNLDAHRTAVEKFYTRTSLVREDTEMSLGFDGDNISLSILRTGVKLESGWRIIPLYDPIIRKGNVDRFSGGQMIPRCELLLQWPHPDKPHVCLLHKIDLIGANGCTFFTLYIPPAGTPTPSHGVSSPSSESTVVSSRGASVNEVSSKSATTNMSAQETKTLGERPTLTKLLEFPVKNGSHINIPQQIGTNYFPFGVLLINDETGAEVNAVTTQHRDNAQQTNLEILRLWIGGKGKPLSWDTLINVLKAIGLNNLAGDIQESLQHNA